MPTPSTSNPEGSNPEGYFQYLPRTQHDQVSGFYVTDFGWTKVQPNMPYPPWQHPSEFAFPKKDSRQLDEYQLIYITHGQGTFWSAETGELPIQPGSALLLFPGIRHKYSPDPETGWTEQWFGFKGDVASRIMDYYFTPEHPLFHIGLMPDVTHLFEKIRGSSQKYSTGLRRLISITAHEILIRLQIATETNKADDNEIRQLCYHIEEHYSETIDFQKYSQSIGISYSTLRRRFKQYTGLAPNQYQLDAKIRNAKELLNNSDLSIQDIAQACGFESPYYFSRYFKSAMGLSPKQYRSRWET